MDAAVAPASPAPVSGPAPTQVIVLPARRAPLGRGPRWSSRCCHSSSRSGAGAVYAVHRSTAPPELTPEQTVNEFLSAVFLVRGSHPRRRGRLHRLERSGRRQPYLQRGRARRPRVMGPGPARLRQRHRRQRDRTRWPAAGRTTTARPLFKEWRFQLKKENGWRVCEARPVAQLARGSCASRLGSRRGERRSEPRPAAGLRGPHILRARLGIHASGRCRARCAGRSGRPAARTPDPADRGHRGRVPDRPRRDDRRGRLRQSHRHRPQHARCTVSNSCFSRHRCRDDEPRAGLFRLPSWTVAEAMAPRANYGRSRGDIHVNWGDLIAHATVRRSSTC